MIYKNLELKGFGIDAWTRSKTLEELGATWRSMLAAVQSYALKVGYDCVYPLADFKNAIEDYKTSGRRVILE